MSDCRGTNPKHWKAHSNCECSTCEHVDHKYLAQYKGCDLCRDENVDFCGYSPHPKLIRDSLYNEALKVFGTDSQMDLTLEEMSELSKAILKARRYIKQHRTDLHPGILEEIKHEIVDVDIMIDQMKCLFFLNYEFAPYSREFKELKEQKLDHLKILIKEQRGRANVS